MNRCATLAVCLIAVAPVAPVGAQPAVDSAAAARALAGTWAGALEHDGERQPFALHLEPGDSGRVALSLSMPVAHLQRAPLGRPLLRLAGDSLRLGPFRFRLDPADSSLHGVIPAGFIPVYSIPFVLRRVERFDVPPRAELTAPVTVPVWTYEAGSALWAGPVHARGTVFVGAEDGSLHAVDARTGARRWVFRADGPVRVRPTVSRNDVFLQADDGFLYRLDAAKGTLRWRVRIVEGPIQRLPFDDPRSRYDRFGSNVVVSHGRLFVGTHDGWLLALDPADGSRVWGFKAGDAVLAAPAVAGERVLFGSYDGHVHALDARSGREVWRHDTRGAVVSTPAVSGRLAIVGNRAYDLLGLDAATGAVVWKRYVWMSWIESSATVADGIAYVGSSDAAAVFAVDAATGATRWTADVHGWSWGQPAVTERRVYAGTASQVGYLASHTGGIVALDRASGAVVWRHPSTAPASGPYGFPGSPAVGAGLVFAGDHDGRLVALRP